ncbi:SGNH/GDSL hydrolase family protein [Streptomyces sp. NBC_01288]|uniref:SGNH/GDSL hydrolase family protein n=1 Tax=Streptomyces sp. NBC_01288 TaxID=2903814 RepID=UPI002E1554F3|nr:SGNH/GDSL hydrolase family protein [Streptomyces sp. NBC_01288]
MSILMGMLMSLGLVAVSSGTANAATSFTTSWTPVNIAHNAIVTSPAGDVTVGCEGTDLVTYNASGVVTRDIPTTPQIDGANNCIEFPVVDKTGDLYGVSGPDLLAYHGNTLKWKYPLSCSSSLPSQYAVGANGNVYATVRESDGVHIIGLNPTLAAGQTVPTKVMDVKGPNDCTMNVYPYKDGVMVRGQQSGGAQYYSYGGTFLGSTNVTDQQSLNATGQLYYDQYVQGSGYRSINVVAFDPTIYDPTVSKTTWSTQVSVPGANVNGIWMQSLANGGVVALVYEQKMSAPNVPFTPTTYEYHLVTLNAFGIQVGSDVTLPNADGLGNSYDRPTLVSDTGGKVSFVREVWVATGNSGTPLVPAIQVSFIDTTTGALTGTQTLSGNATPASGSLYGYDLITTGFNGPISGPNGLYVVAQCVKSCPSGSTGTKLYPITMTGASMDYPRGSVLTQSQRPTAAYWALGDSFSSGEGNSPFLAGTDSTINTCHRSSVAYPEVLSGSSVKIPTLTTAGFRACSGAVTGNIWDYDRWNESFQTDWWPDTTTTLVTITIGGNDIGFSDFASACALPNSSCDSDTPAYTNALNHINGDLATKLTAAYQNILTMAPNAKVYVIGYPQVVANKLVNDPIDARCPTLYQGTTHYGNARAARYIVTQLDQKISTTVGAVGNARLRYIPADGSSSPFVGHEICGTSSTTWFQNLDQALTNKAYVFHPNALGQQGYATLVAPVINAG